jgi:hypothetical protein
MQDRIRTYDIIQRRPDAFDHSATRMWVAVIFNETPNGNCLSLSPDYLIRTGDLSISHTRRFSDTTTVDCSANWAKSGEEKREWLENNFD